jgi:nucleotide-binding universal stress UspA family protein
MSYQVKRIVVGVSDSLAGLEALRTAVAEARLRDAAVLAVRAWTFRAGSREPGVPRWRREIAAEAARTLTRAFAAAMGGPPDDVTVEMTIAEGLPERVLVDLADRVDDLLVIGGTGAGVWHPGRTLVVRYCARRARCSSCRRPNSQGSVGRARWHGFCAAKPKASPVPHRAFDH